MSIRIRILLADDHAGVRRGIRQLLTLSPGFDVVGEAADGAEAVRMVAELTPDVVVMDIQMPGMDGVEATRLIAAGGGGPKIIAFSASDQEDAYAIVNAGAAAFVPKGRAYAELAPAIERLFPWTTDPANGALKAKA